MGDNFFNKRKKDTQTMYIKGLTNSCGGGYTKEVKRGKKREKRTKKDIREEKMVDEKKKRKKKAGIIAGSVVAAGIVVGGVTGGIIAGTAKVTVQFNTEDGKNWVKYSDVTIRKGSSARLPELTRAGYRFTGWYLDAQKTIQVDSSTRYKKDTVLYAGWKENSYTVRYVDEIASEINYGKSSLQDPSIGAVNEIKTINNIEDVDKNYEFLGWNETPIKNPKSEEEVKYRVNSGSVIQYNMPLYGGTLYAVWRGKEVEVTIGGETERHRLGEEITLPGTGSVENFAGWIIKGETYRPGETITLTKKMLTGDKIAINEVEDPSNQGIEFYDYNGEKIADIEISASGITKPREIAGYEFKGWYLTQDGSGNEIKSDSDLAGIKGKKVLYAKREAKEVEIKLDYGSAVAIDSEKTVKRIRGRVGESRGIVEYSTGEEREEEINLIEYARNYAGYNVDFVNWKYEESVIDLAKGYRIPATDAEEITITATWGSSRNLLFFNLNGGDEWGAEIGESYHETGTVRLPEIEPTRLGYTFAGWGLSVERGEVYAAGSEFRINAQEGRRTLYAQWDVKSYDIEYKLGDWYKGEIEDEQGNKVSYGGTIDTKQIQSEVNEAREGYTFKEWQITYSNEVVGRIDANGKIDITSAIVGKETTKIEIRAIWEAKRYRFEIDTRIEGVVIGNDDVNINFKADEKQEDGTYNVEIKYNDVRGIPYGSEVTIDRAVLYFISTLYVPSSCF